MFSWLGTKGRVSHRARGLLQADWAMFLALPLYALVMSARGQNPTTCLAAARPILPSADIGQRTSAAGATMKYIFEVARRAGISDRGLSAVILERTGHLPTGPAPLGLSEDPRAGRAP